MARPRLPALKAEASGAALKNPGRFATRTAPKRIRSLGEPYASMSPGECGCWEEFRKDLPWLHSGHRRVVMAACRLAWQLETEPEFGVNKIQALSSLLSKLGATPVDETKVMHGDDDGSEDPAEEFFARPN